MIAGKNLSGLAKEILRQHAIKVDYIVGARSIAMDPLTGDFIMQRKVADPISIQPNRIFTQQVAEFTGIPQRYYDRMKEEQPDLLASNVNRWLAEAGNSARLVRTLGGSGRAFLSDSYRTLDHIDVAKNILPTLEARGLEIKSAEVTDRRLYIQAIAPRLEGEVKVGDPVQAGVLITNSEVGLGSVTIKHLLYRLVCTNGAIMQTVARKAHIGGTRGEWADAQQFFRSDTQKAADKAFWMKTRDVMDSMLTREALEGMIAQMRGAAKIELPSVEAAIEVTAKRFGLLEGERHSVLEHLARGGDMTVYGLANAITRTAQDSASYDRAIELEEFGGKAYQLTAKEISE